jgi:hypothetical protein
MAMIFIRTKLAIIMPVDGLRAMPGKLLSQHEELIPNVHGDIRQTLTNFFCKNTKYLWVLFIVINVPCFMVQSKSFLIKILRISRL